MLLYFKVKNYRSIRDEAVLDMEAAGLHDAAKNLLPFGKKEYLPAVAIYGKNGGGKSNLIRSMWLAVQFICNAQKTQTENEPVPVRPFMLNDYSVNEPSAFEFAYVQNRIKYVYGFSATRDHIVSEYLKAWPKGREKNIFLRHGQSFIFPKDNEKKRKELIKEAVGKNQLFFAISCTMNYKPCIEAMKWFREKIVFSRDFTDINRNLIDYREDETMLQAIVSAAKTADVGIEDIQFEIDQQTIDLKSQNVSDQVRGMIAALRAFSDALQQNGNEAEVSLNMGKLKSTTYHTGLNCEGKASRYELTLSDESDGTRRLMTLAPAIERTLKEGGTLVVDELEREMHLMLIEYVLGRYQEKRNNPAHAQLIFTTHDTSLLNQEILRRDQIYFVDKKKEDGASSLYSLADFNIRNDANIQKAYLLGKFGAVPSIEELD
ncbi:MAG TPA: ATP-binding protein [Candidatus Eisenbergiella intestinipullorum]|nr:ATP-binding protein [Candidatus Eisenbergiella intestinipullorum]